jgi:hypothetical protein
VPICVSECVLFGLSIVCGSCNRVIQKVTLSMSLRSPLQTPILVVSVAEYGNFIKSQYEMLKLSIQCPQDWRLITVVVQIPEWCANRCNNNSEGTHEKGKERQDETQLITKIDGFLSSTQLNANLFCFFFFFCEPKWTSTHQRKINWKIGLIPRWIGRKIR